MTHLDLEHFVRSYNRSRYRLMASGRSLTNLQRWESFEDAIDFKFPLQFREFSLSPLGGLYLEVLDDLWPRPPLPDEPLSWQNLYSIKVFGIGLGVPSWLDLRVELNALPKQETDLIPFMARGDEPDRFCFDLDHQIVYWSASNGNRTLLQHSFYSLLLAEIEELELRREQIMSPAPVKKKRTRKKKN